MFQRILRVPGRSLAAACALAALAVLPSSCGALRELGIGGEHPQWVSKTFYGIPKADVVRMAAIEIERKGFELQHEDPYEGTVQSTWVFDHDLLSHRGTRERVLVEVDREDDGLELRLRVQVERNEEMGRFYDMADGDWGPHDDNLIVARELVQHLAIVLGDFLTPPEEVASGP